MAIVKQRTLQDLLQQGIEQARRISGNVLVSQLTHMPSVEPFAFFANAGGERFFWRDPKQQIIIAGSGLAGRLISEKEDRFAHIEQQRKALLRHAVLDVEPFIPATGPVFFGGFAFDPLKSRRGLWDDFLDAQLSLPRFMLTMVHGETWLTCNCIVDADTNPAEEAEQLFFEQRQLLENAPARDLPDESLGGGTSEEIAPRQWKGLVAEAAQQIRDQQLEKVVLSRELKRTVAQPFSPTRVLRRLSGQQPNSYVFAVSHGASCFLGASPERLVKQQGEQLLSTCLAGSIGRGANREEDQALGKQLLGDQKNLYEHGVVVTMIREAMQEVSEHVDVADHPVLYQMKDIQHLYTPVVGRAPGDSSLLEMVARLHPTPALGGFPQLQALQKIRAVEPHNRGWYGAPIGWVDYNGEGEFAVAIRSGLLQGNEARLFAGSGIVGDSDPEDEYRETQLKFQPMLSALGGER